MTDGEEKEIDLTIEAITGTVYDLCVSSYETILGIKTKIQRLEGIPVCQQHLIYKEMELEDEFCLEEYNIKTGSQLRLITALRGGPIHAHRIQFEDSALLELAEYLETTQSTDEQDQYTVMILSPVEVSESRMSKEPPSLPTESQELTGEHVSTKDKVIELQQKLRNLHLKKRDESYKVDYLKRKHGGKLIILDSRASTSLSSSTTALTPAVFSACKKSSRMPITQRTLLFSPSEKMDNNVCCKQSRSHDQSRIGKKFDENSRDNIKTKHKEALLNQDFLKMLSDLTLDDSDGEKNSIFQRSKCIVGDSKRHFLPQIAFNKNTRKITSGTRPLRSVQHLPPLPIGSKEVSPQKKNRCMQCGRRTRLATTFTCRCGGIFCAMHRYAERHLCTFDYQAEGKAIISQSNPLITSSKLPKL